MGRKICFYALTAFFLFVGNAFAGQNVVGNLNVTGSVGVGTSSVFTYNFSMTGQSDQTIGVVNHTTANTAANDLILQASSPASGATSKPGGDIILKTGQSTGANTSNISFFTSPNTAASTNYNTLAERVRILGTGEVGIGTTTPNQTLHVVGSSRTGDALGNYTLTYSDGSTVYEGAARPMAQKVWMMGTETGDIRLPATGPAVFEAVGDANGEYGVATFVNNSNTSIDLRWRAASNYPINGTILLTPEWYTWAVAGNVTWNVKYKAVGEGENLTDATWATMTNATFAVATNANVTQYNPIYVNASALGAVEPGDDVTIRLTYFGEDEDIGQNVTCTKTTLRYLVES